MARYTEILEEIKAGFIAIKGKVNVDDKILQDLMRNIVINSNRIKTAAYIHLALAFMTFGCILTVLVLCLD